MSNQLLIPTEIILILLFPQKAWPDIVCCSATVIIFPRRLICGQCVRFNSTPVGLTEQQIFVWMQML